MNKPFFGDGFNPMQTNPYGSWFNPVPNYGSSTGTQFNQFVPISNKTFVSSLEDALNRPCEYNSQMVYFDQNKDVLYDICTNGRGEKSWAIINLTLGETSASARANHQVTTDKLLQKINELEQKLEVLNGKYNAQQTDAGNECSVQSLAAGGTSR